MKVLTIISHTEHYVGPDGSIVGLASTVTELNHLISVFDEIRHVAMLHDTIAPESAIPYTSDSIKFIPIPAVGGNSLINKLSLLTKGPRIIQMVNRALKGSDFFQFRAPTGIGVYIIPYLIFSSSIKGWFKYAGNWKQAQAPLAYRFQKWLLKQQKRPVTINGFWSDQPKHCLSFENPCLTDYDIKIGNQVRAEKSFTNQLELCFVGRLESEKGLDYLIDAVNNLDKDDLAKIKQIFLVGTSHKFDYYKSKIEKLMLPFVFKGYLSRNEVHEIYKRCHAIVLPSASEGFPKVIAEAMNYGCLPIVSNVSSIGHYIKHNENGLLINNITSNEVRKKIIEFLNLNTQNYKKLITQDQIFLRKFSYKYYNDRVENELIKN